MTYREFVSYIEENYDYDIGIDPIENSFYDLCDADMELETAEYILKSDDIKVAIFDNGKFSLYKEFFNVYNENSLENAITELYERNTINLLKESLNNKLEEKYDDCMGSPMDVTCVGYFNIEYNLEFLKKFIQCCRNVKVSATDMNMLLLHKVQTTLKEKDFSDITIELRRMGYKFYQKTTFDSAVVIENHDEITDYEIYEGSTVVCLKLSNSKEISFPMNCWLYINNIIKKLYIDDEVEFFLKGNIFTIKVSYLIFELHLQTEMNMLEHEYLYLLDKLMEIQKLRNKFTIHQLNFTSLTASEFEMLCVDILSNLNFINIKSMGKTNAPDGGVDILAEEILSGCLRDEKRKWLWQCKHSKKSLGRKDIAEIKDLLDEHNATCYGLFCSNDLTQDAINRLEIKKEKNSDIVIEWYGKRELYVMLNKCPELIKKYRLL